MNYYLSLDIIRDTYKEWDVYGRRLARALRSGLITATKVEDKQGLTSDVYFSLPQLLAFDFYIAHKKEGASAADGNRFGRGKYVAWKNMLNSIIPDLLNLPNTGWSLDDFSVHIFRIEAHKGILFAVYGTNFHTRLEIFEKHTTEFIYRGKDLRRRIEAVISQPKIIRQDKEDSTYFDLFTHIRKASWKQAL